MRPKVCQTGCLLNRDISVFDKFKTDKEVEGKETPNTAADTITNRNNMKRIFYLWLFAFVTLYVLIVCVVSITHTITRQDMLADAQNRLFELKSQMSSALIF